MLNVCGRIVDDPLIYEDIGDSSDMIPQVPFLESYMESIQVTSFAHHAGLARQEWHSISLKLNNRF